MTGTGKLTPPSIFVGQQGMVVKVAYEDDAESSAPLAMMIDDFAQCYPASESLPLLANFRKRIDTTIAVINCATKRQLMTDNDEYEPVKISQTRGPRLEFEGKLLCEDDSGPVSLEIWQTRGGAYVAVTEAPMRGDQMDTRATVVEPGEEQAMRLAVMDAFDWENRARSMVRKQLKWQLVQEVA